MEDWGAWSGIAYAVVGGLAVLLALFVLRAAPPTARNRWLSVLLLVMGGHAVLFGLYSTQQWGYAFSTEDTQRGLLIAAWTLFTWMPFVYLALLRKTLPRRRWWNGRIPLVFLLVATVGWLATSALMPSLWTTGRVLMFGIYAGGAISILGFLVAVQWVIVSLWIRQERRIAFAFLIAFSIRNLQFIRDLVLALSEDLRGEVIALGPIEWYRDWNFDLWQDVVLEGAFLTLLAFAVLSGQIVTLDNRIKASIRTGTVSLVLTVVFLILTEGMEAILGVESILFSILGAVAISLLIMPVHRWSEVIATRLVPGAHLIGTLPAKERRDTYLQQAVLAWEDGVLRPKEVNMLGRLQVHLGLDEETVARLDERAKRMARDRRTG